MIKSSHCKNDWDDARRKLVSISPSGVQARDAALQAITPMIADAVESMGEDNVRKTVPVLRGLRGSLAEAT